MMAVGSVPNLAADSDKRLRSSSRLTCFSEVGPCGDSSSFSSGCDSETVPSAVPWILSAANEEEFIRSLIAQITPNEMSRPILITFLLLSVIIRRADCTRLSGQWETIFQGLWEEKGVRNQFAAPGGPAHSWPSLPSPLTVVPVC